jgi:hypothetical protein
MIIKLFRIILIICLIFALIAGVLLVALKLFSAYSLKSVLMSSSKGLLVRELKVKNASIGLFEGFVLEDFTLSRYPGFKYGTFLTAKKLTVKTNTLRLFKRKFILSNVDLTSPVFEISRNDSCLGFLFPFMFSIKELNIKELNLKDAKVKYELENKDIVDLSDINLNCSNITLEEPFNFSVKMILSLPQNAHDRSRGMNAFSQNAEMSRILTEPPASAGGAPNKKSGINISSTGSVEIANKSITLNNLVLNSKNGRLVINCSIKSILDDDFNFTASVKGDREVFEQVRNVFEQVLDFIPEAKNISIFDNNIDADISYKNKKLVFTQRRE